MQVLSFLVVIFPKAAPTARIWAGIPISPRQMDAKREFLRHALATLAYRAAKPLRNVPVGFAETRVAATTRSAAEIVAHMGDLMQWAARMCEGVHWWEPKPPQDLQVEIARFFDN